MWSLHYSFPSARVKERSSFFFFFFFFSPSCSPTYVFLSLLSVAKASLLWASFEDLCAQHWPALKEVTTTTTAAAAVCVRCVVVHLSEPFVSFPILGLYDLKQRFTHLIPQPPRSLLVSEKEARKTPIEQANERTNARKNERTTKRAHTHLACTLTIGQGAHKQRACIE